MGFSLGRALAGAIAGGAGAVASNADMQMREAAKARDDERQMARQRALMQEQDQLLAGREQRIAETKERLENNKRDKVAGFMKLQLSALREEGVNPGSVAGQQRLAAAAGEAGYQDYADKFFDNATRLGQIESNDALRREEMKTRAETARLAREGMNDRKASEKEDKEELRRQTEIYRMGNVPGLVDREGKQGKPFDAKPYLVGVYRDAIENGLPPSQAFDAAVTTRKLIDKGLSTNPDVDFGTLADKAAIVASSWRKPVAPVAKEPSPVQAAAPVTAPAKKVYTPSFFERTASDSSAPLAQPTSDPYQMAKQAGRYNK